MTSTNEENPRVLRVTQLDAHNIDNSIFTNLQTDIKSTFGNDSLSFLSHVEPEINALLRYILWRLSIRDEGVTVGQKMFNTQYLSDNKRMGTKQRLVYGIIVVLLPWIKERYNNITNCVDFFLKLGKLSPTRQQNQQQKLAFGNYYKHVENTIKLLTLLNFLAFLRNGRFVSVLQRLLGLDHVFTRKPSPRYIDYGYMRKEMIWESTAQTIIAVLPLVNIKKLSNFVLRTSIHLNLISSADEVDMITCPICQEKVTNPHSAVKQIDNLPCHHMFCYFCIQSNLIADANFACPVCGKAIVEIAPSVMNNRWNELD